MSSTRLIALLIALGTLLVYLPITRNDFIICDDDEYVTANPVVQHGLTFSGIGWAFTTFHASNWHPLTWISLMTDCEFFHLNAGAHHAVSAIFHAANAVLLFLLAWRLTRRIPPALLVAALFACHPAHVESVAWASERKDVLSMFFGLLAFLAYAKLAQGGSRLNYWLALGWYACSLLSKATLVTLPLLLLLLDFWPLQRRRFGQFPRKLVAEKLPFLGLAVAASVMTYMAEKAGGSVTPLNSLPLRLRLENSAVAAMRYLIELLWPTDLAFMYPYHPIPTALWVGALAGLLAISALVWQARRRHPCWLMGWLWFLGALVPTIGLVQIGGIAMADRYTYVPSIGIFLAGAFGLYELASTRRLFALGSALALLGCIAATERQLGYWHDSKTLMRHTVAVTADNEIGHFLLGMALERAGEAAEALAEFREVLRINPAHFQVHYSVGKELAALGRPQEALLEFRQCLSRDPQRPKLHIAAGCALADLGDLGAARAEFDQAERLDPHSAQPHLELARICLEQGLDEQAISEVRAAVQAEPEDIHTLTTAAHYLAAHTNPAVGDGQMALILALKAHGRSDNRQPEVFDTLGMAFAATGDFTNAMVCARNALASAKEGAIKDLTPLQTRLDLYQKQQPWRESFRKTNGPPLPKDESDHSLTKN